MPPDPRTYIWDAMNAADLLHSFTTGKSLADYQADALLRSGVERQFEIIGEALNKLSKVDAVLASGIPELARIVAFRNILIHGYATVDDVLVWQVVVDRLPPLVAVLRQLLGRDSH